MRTQRWMQKAKSKGVGDVGHMEIKLREMGRELSALRDREEITRSHLEIENELLRRQLQEKETQLACMASLSMEALQCRTVEKSYGLYLKDQWLQFQVRLWHKEAQFISKITRSLWIYVTKPHQRIRKRWQNSTYITWPSQT